MGQVEVVTFLKNQWLTKNKKFFSVKEISRYIGSGERLVRNQLSKLKRWDFVECNMKNGLIKNYRINESKIKYLK